MTSEELSKVFRNILAASLGSGALLGAAGCSAMVAPPDGTPSRDVVVGDGSDVTIRPDVTDPPDVTRPDVVVRDAPDVVTPVDVVDVADGSCAPVVRTSDCDATITWPCAPPPELRPDGGVSPENCRTFCPPSRWGSGSPIWCNSTVNGAELSLSCTYCAVGRRTDGLAAVEAPADADALARFFATNAAYELASVTAFERLADELIMFDAPQSLVLWARQSADEEREHTRIVRELAERFGAAPIDPTIEPVASRTLFDVARENVTEGCVRETFGALVAQWQARATPDRELRAAFETLATDETRHAAFSWALDAWIRTRLDREQNETLDARRRDAIADLRFEVDRGIDRALVCVAGVPETDDARRLLDELDARVWS